MIMKRFIAGTVGGLVLLAGLSGAASAQAVFKIPFKFEAGGKKLPAGEYRVSRADDGGIILRQDEKGLEVAVPVQDRLAQPNPPLAEPQLVFDAVGNFEPSYTEYYTVYLLSEVWLPDSDGCLIHTTKGAHQTQIIKGRSADQ
jgi:hypothetical protein